MNRRDCPRAVRKNRRQQAWNLGIWWFGRKFLNPAWIPAAVWVCVSAWDPALVTKHASHDTAGFIYLAFQMRNEGTWYRPRGSGLSADPLWITEPDPCRPKRVPVFDVQSLGYLFQICFVEEVAPLPPFFPQKKKDRWIDVSFPITLLTHGSNSVKQGPMTMSCVFFPVIFLFLY